MKKINLIIAALHAGAMALTAGPGIASAQDAQEVRAYMEALRAGTTEAMTAFLTAYPNSALPGSVFGASIAAGVDQPTASVGTSDSVGTSVSAPTDHGFRNDDDRHGVY